MTRIVVLTFREIDNKGLLIDFERFQTKIMAA